MTQINWYPGHMKKTKDLIEENLKLIDVVLEIVDARIPLSSKNPNIASLSKNKKRIIVLNKSESVKIQQSKTIGFEELKEGSAFKAVLVTDYNGNLVAIVNVKEK